MVIHYGDKKRPLIKRIVDYLVLNYPCVPSVGIGYGKMGGVIFFHRYAEYSGLCYFHDFADELLENVYDGLTAGTPIAFDTGLCGVGWGIEYLIQHGLSGGNTDEILGEMDTKILEMAPQYITDLSLEAGLGGVLYYVLARLESFERPDGRLPFDNEFLVQLGEAIHRADPTESGIPERLVTRYDDHLNGYADYAYVPDFPPHFLPEVCCVPDNLDNIPIGITSGLTGIALNMIRQ